MIEQRDRNLQLPVDPPDSYWGDEPDKPFCDICNDTGYVQERAFNGEPYEVDVPCVDCLTGVRRKENRKMKNNATIKNDMINDLRDNRNLDEFNFDPLSTLDVALFHVAIFGCNYFGSRFERDGVKANYSKALKIILVAAINR